MNHQLRATRVRRTAAAVGVLLLASAALAGCGDDAEGSDSTTLRVNVFGNFGYEDLYKQFEKDHPGVKIVETAEGDLGQYNTQLTQKIAAGSGAGDVVAIEEGQVVNFLQSADKFVNFQDHGSNDKKDQWLDWKYSQATTADGTDTIGLGTDVGGLAMCYRRTCSRRPACPTDRDEVGALWPTWDDFIATGEKFQAGIGADDVHFIDSATNTYNSILMQSGDHTYFDPDGTLVIETNPAVKEAWDDVGRDGRRRHHRQAEVLLQRVERRLQERHLRHRRLPRVDDRLHQGAGRRGQRGQVGHRLRPRRRRQLGRLLPRRAQAEQAPGRGHRAGQLPHQRRRASSRRSRRSATCRPTRRSTTTRR